MVLAFRFVALLLFAAAAHFGDGLAFAALAAGGLIGWLRWPVWLLAAPALGLGIYASEIYAHAASSGKLSGALSNFAFETLVFALVSGLGWGVARALRGKRA